MPLTTGKAPHPSLASQRYSARCCGLTSIFVRLPRINKSSSCGDISDLGQDLLVLPAAAPSEKGTDLKRELHKASLAMVSPNDPLCRESGGCGFGFELRGARREEPCLVD